MKKAFALSTLAILLLATLATAANAPTTRFVQSATKRHIAERYPGSTIIELSPVSKSSVDKEHAWYVKALFVYLGEHCFGEFWLQPENKTSGFPVVVKSNVRPH